MSFHNLLTVYKHAILPAITYASEAWSTTISIRAKSKLQQIQRTFLIYITKAYRTVSYKALSAISGIMPLDQAMHLYKDIRAISRGQPTNAVIPKLKKIEVPIKTRGIHQRNTCGPLRNRRQRKRVHLHRWLQNRKPRRGKYGSSEKLH